MASGGNLDLLTYALLATLSPVGFAATLAVIGSGRLKAFVFGVGLVGAQLVSLAALVVLGNVADPTHDPRHPTFRALLELGFGVALVLLAGVVRRRPESMVTRSNGRTTALLERLRRLHTGTALVAGILLGIGGPKRLVLTALAAGAITSSTGDTSQLVVFYSLVATLLVWGPILAFEIAGQRIVAWLSTVQRRGARRGRAVSYYGLLVIGAIALADAVSALLS